jgi:hypothetical protein
LIFFPINWDEMRSKFHWGEIRNPGEINSFLAFHGASNEQRTTNNEQQTTNNEQQTPNNEHQTPMK